MKMVISLLLFSASSLFSAGIPADSNNIAYLGRLLSAVTVAEKNMATTLFVECSQPVTITYHDMHPPRKIVTFSWALLKSLKQTSSFKFTKKRMSEAFTHEAQDKITCKYTGSFPAAHSSALQVTMRRNRDSAENPLTVMPSLPFIPALETQNFDSQTLFTPSVHAFISQHGLPELSIDYKRLNVSIEAANQKVLYFTIGGNGCHYTGCIDAENHQKRLDSIQYPIPFMQ